MSPASPLAAQHTRLPVRLAGSSDGHQRECIAASCVAVKIGLGPTIAANRAAMKACIHRTRPARAAKREAHCTPTAVGVWLGVLLLCPYWTCCSFKHFRGDFDSDLGHSHLLSLTLAGVRWLPDGSGRRYPALTRPGGADKIHNHCPIRTLRKTRVRGLR